MASLISLGVESGRLGLRFWVIVEVKWDQFVFVNAGTSLWEGGGGVVLKSVVLVRSGT